jgi:UDP-N-acetylglucosamine 2-epimerase
LKNVAVVFGTRPEAIKLARAILCLKRCTSLRTTVCATAQHRQMLDQVLEVPSIKPDFGLDLMCPNQTLRGLTDSEAYGRMPNARNPYGDGRAAERIVDACLAFVSSPSRKR